MALKLKKSKKEGWIYRFKERNLQHDDESFHPLIVKFVISLNNLLNADFTATAVHQK